MKSLNRFALLAVLSLGSVAQAQTTGSTGFGSGSSNGTGSSTASTGFGGATGQTAAPTITGTSIGQTTAGSSTSVSNTNAFASFYANPEYQGRPGSTGNDNPGGFGVALSSGSSSGGSSSSAFNKGTSSANGSFGSGNTNRSTSGSSSSGITPAGSSTSGTTIGQGFGSGFGGSSSSGRSGSSSTFGSSSGSFGSSSSTFGSTNRNSSFGSSGSNGQQQGMIAQQARPVNYTLNPAFPISPIPQTQLTSELQSSISRSSFLSSPGSVNVNYTGNAVVLRGAVKDRDEARIAEGVARLTPGVRNVKNELTYPAPAATK